MPLSRLPDLDESKCGGKNLSQPMFSCADGTCLPKTKLCDGKRDCDDGSDESACDSANEANHARPCDVEKCRLPKCFCSPSGKEIPGGLKKGSSAQFFNDFNLLRIHSLTFVVLGVQVWC